MPFGISVPRDGGKVSRPPPRQQIGLSLSAPGWRTCSASLPFEALPAWMISNPSDVRRPTPQLVNATYAKASSSTYRPWSVKHSNTEVPQAKPTVLSNTPKSVVLVITAPGVECYRGNPRVMTLTARDNCRLRWAPDRYQVVLPASEYILAVR